jgi:hypothetical protein
VEGFISGWSIVTSALKMETEHFSETLASTDESTRRQNPDEHHHPHRRENLKSHKFLLLLPRFMKCYLMFRNAFELKTLRRFDWLSGTPVRDNELTEQNRAQSSSG